MLPFDATEHDMVLARSAFDEAVSALELTGATLLPAWDLSEWSRTYAIHQASNRWYLKATPRSRHESDLLGRLNALVPSCVPRLVLDDVLPTDDLRWFLMEDAGVVLDGDVPVSAAEQVIRTMANIQTAVLGDPATQSLVPHHDSIVGTLQGFRAWLNEQVGSESLRERLDHLITKDTFLTSLQTQFDTVPPSLVHPDLFCGNWAMDGERIRIFDWGDAMWTTGGYIVVALVAQQEELRPHESQLWQTYGDAMGCAITTSYQESCWVVADILDLAIHAHINESCVVTPPFLGAIEQILARLIERAEH